MRYILEYFHVFATFDVESGVFYRCFVGKEQVFVAFDEIGRDGDALKFGGHVVGFLGVVFVAGEGEHFIVDEELFCGRGKLLVRLTEDSIIEKCPHILVFGRNNG